MTERAIDYGYPISIMRGPVTQILISETMQTPKLLVIVQSHFPLLETSYLGLLWGRESYVTEFHVREIIDIILRSLLVQALIIALEYYQRGRRSLYQRSSPELVREDTASDRSVDFSIQFRTYHSLQSQRHRLTKQIPGLRLQLLFVNAEVRTNCSECNGL